MRRARSEGNPALPSSPSATAWPSSSISASGAATLSRCRASAGRPLEDDVTKIRTCRSCCSRTRPRKPRSRSWAPLRRSRARTRA